MVCDGPDPPDNSPHELNPPARHEVMMIGDDSDEETQEHFGYEPLPQGPEAAHSDHESDEEAEATNQAPQSDIPNIEPMENALSREAWSTPRPADPIQMDNERAQQVMSAMANFALPQASIPEWAQSISEEQWKQTLTERIERIKSNS